MVSSPHWNQQTLTSTAPDSLLLAGFCQHDDDDDDDVKAYNDSDDDDQEQGEPWGGEQQRAGEKRQCPGEHLLSAFFIGLFYCLFYWAFLLAFFIGLS